MVEGRLAIRRIVLLKYPAQDTEKADAKIESIRVQLRKEADVHFMSLAVEKLIAKATDTSRAREIFNQAMAELPKGPRLGPGQYEKFFTFRKPWTEYKELFGHLHRSNVNGSGDSKYKVTTKQPEYTVLGWFFFSSLKGDALQAHVREACQGVDDLKEVVQWKQNSLPSPSV